MGISADLFHSTDAARETLHRRITPTTEQSEAQTGRWNDLRDFLVDRLRADAGVPIATWLQGSYKFGTQIRPWNMKAQFDIDLGVYFQWAGGPDDGVHEPEDLKALVQAALVDYAADADNDATGVEDPKERCCRISFHPDFHIDAPCYHLDPEHDARSLATETRGWEASDPKAIYKWFKEVRAIDAERTQLRRQVRYLKMWAALNFEEKDRPSSILLTVLAAEALDGVAIAGVADDDLLLHVAIVARERLAADHAVPNPVDAGEDLNRLDHQGSAALAEAFSSLATIAQRAGGSGSRSSSAEIWAEAFGQFFPMPEDNAEGDLAKALSSNGAIALYAFDPRIEVQATPKANANRNWNGVSSLPPIPKNCSIRFRLANADLLPHGATLRWTVRNRGDEAASMNDLGHWAGDAAEITKNSAYIGDHAMDLTVYLGDQVIGRRRVSIRIQGAPMPARHKPAGRRFRR